MATHSSTLAWKTPWMEEPDRLQSMESLRVGHDDWATSFTFHIHALEKETATHSSVLAWRIPGTGEPGGLQSMGSHRVGHDWSDLAAVAVGKLWETVRARETWRAAVHGVAKSRTRLSNWTTTTSSFCSSVLWNSGTFWMFISATWAHAGQS